MAVSSYDFCGCLFALLLSLICGALGASSFGWLGAVAGAPIGLVVGWFAGWFLVEANFALAIRGEVSERRRTLRPIFGEYWKPDRKTEWEQVVGSLKTGDSLTGQVVAHFDYGVVLDVGLGFPAILTKLRFHTPFAENPPIGAEVTARIDEICHANRELHLTQGRTFAETVASAEGTEESPAN